MAAGTSDYPTSLDTTTNLPAASTLATAELDGDGNANVQHSNLHGVVDTAIVQIETKLGTGSSTPGAAGKLLRATSASASAWSTLTFPDTAAISTIIYASAADTLAALATANNGVLVTSGTGVPSISSTLPAVTINGVLTLAGNVTRAADQTIDLTGAATRTLTLQNSTASQVANMDVDGVYVWRNGHATGTFTFAGTPTAARTITWQDASSTVAMYSNDLSVFAATTSAQLAGVISDETGSGALLFATSPTMTGTWAGAVTLSGSTLTFSGGTASTSTSTGTIVISGSGGLGVGGTQYIGGNLFLAAASGASRLDISGSGTGAQANPIAQIRTPQTNPQFVFQDSGAANSNASFAFNKSRGNSISSPTVITVGDVLGQMVFQGHDGTSFVGGADFYVDTIGTIGANRIPGRYHWRVATDAAPGVLADRMTLTAAAWTLTSGTTAAINDATASTSTTTGALVVTGGVGVGGALYLGGLLAISSGINEKIGATTARATTEATNALYLFDGTAPVGTLANGITLYSTLGELRVMDSAGNATLLSPHARDGSWIYDSVSPVTGKHLRVDMERMVKFLNEKFGQDWVKEVEV